MTTLTRPIYERPIDKMTEEEAVVVRRDVMQVIREMQEISRQNGNSEMTIDEINEVIAETRREMREENESENARCH